MSLKLMGLRQIVLVDPNIRNILRDVLFILQLKVY